MASTEKNTPQLPPINDESFSWNGLSSGEHWPTMAISGERVLLNAAERAAWIGSGLRGFVLASGYSKTSVSQQASVILWRWPQLKTFIELPAPGLPIQPVIGPVVLLINPPRG